MTEREIYLWLAQQLDQRRLSVEPFRWKDIPAGETRRIFNDGYKRALIEIADEMRRLANP